MNLQTERLILRPFKPNDFERVHLYAGLPDFSQFDSWGPNSEEDTHKFITDAITKLEKNPPHEFEFAVCLKESNLLIGGCGIRRESQESRVANLGYGINPNFQGQGFATEVTRKLIATGFQQFNLAVIYATCDTRNTPSFKVMENAGMTRVGHIIKHKKVRDIMLSLIHI